MTYHFSKMVDMSFDDAITHVTEALKEKGFGILTTIDVKTAMKEKLDKDINPYMILGACSPPHAYQAIQKENKIGTMLPCNVLVQQTDSGAVEVSAVDPMASMQAIENPALGAIASEVQGLLKQVVDGL